MSDDARPEEAGTTPGSRARRRRPVLLVAAVALLVSGVAAVAVGVAGQQSAPPSAVESPVEPVETPSPVEPVETDEPTTPVEPVETPPVEATAAQPLPTEVSIPSIDVASDLLHLGLNADGTVAVPEGDDVDTAAWFDGSPRPGAVGPAVIEGHVDSVNGESVFYDLATVEPGATIDVGREDGSTVSYVVDRVEQYPKNEFPTLAVYGNTESPELRVITCGGSWDPEIGHYRDNTVVYAHLAE
ncbi:Sortase family protein [Paraoerskovia marina]|uniref:Sortase family protein n=1 Tax=Paraoerskovia marina TaxID=545619 RepID=A0A1H1NTJ1_9CELL|nr:class F sortase [Paraoerskovia marina]SDS01689.1 Sortase family protein [Paraoerskovia marina]